MDRIWFIFALASYSLLALSVAMCLKKHDAEPVSVAYAKWRKAKGLDKLASAFFVMVACVVFAVKPLANCGIVELWNSGNVKMRNFCSAY